MGYTHYFKRQQVCPPEVWAKIVTDVKTVVSKVQDLGIPLAWEDDEPAKEPEFTDSLIRFNGVGDAGCETFYFEAAGTDGHRGIGDWFCKTGDRPYDLAVCLALLVVGQHAPDVWELLSDGGPEDWLPAARIFQELFQEQPKAFLKMFPEAELPTLLGPDDLAPELGGGPDDFSPELGGQAA